MVILKKIKLILKDNIIITNNKMNLKLSKKEFTKYLTQIVDTPGISGFENLVTNFLYSNLKSSNYTFIKESQGSLICKKTTNNKSKLKILLDTHVDEIGFLVANITKKGFVKFVPIGGWWSHTILSQRLNIITRQNKIITGIVGSIPIHILPKEKYGKVVDIENMYLDIGASSKEEAIELGIQIGDPIYKNSKSFLMANENYFCGKALDNRISCSILFYLLKIICDKKINNEIYGVFSSQEEVGIRGVETSTYIINPDVAIVIDTTLSHDQPGMNHNNCNLGNGPALEVLDAMSISNPKLLNYVKNIARKNKIPFTYSCLTGGGTNGGNVHKAKKGILTIVLSIPTRYLHTHNEIININDSLNCIKLLFSIITDLTKEKINSFV